MASSRALSVPELLAAIAVAAIICASFFLTPHPGSSLGAAKRAQAKNDVRDLATAVTAFHTEYGRLPGTNSGPVAGDVLQALLGKNKTLNPREIIFMEPLDARKGRSGLSNGAFVAPWGEVYQIAFDADYDGRVVAGTNNELVGGNVAAWSDPRLGEKAGSWFFSKESVRSVTSWDSRNP